MARGWGRQARSRGGGSRNRPLGCALWLIVVLLVVLALELLFGGFQLGTRAGNAVPVTPSVYVANG